MKKLILLILAILLCEGVGGLGSIFTFPSITGWYATLNKPFFNPPNFVFGPVWTTLFLLMGISLFLIWTAKTKQKNRKKACLYFYVQLALNFLWSVMFFTVHSPALAFITIVLLWIMILLTIIEFKKISKPAWILLLPYLAWVSFAAILNFFIVLLN